jgi:hypothetical protein
MSRNLGTITADQSGRAHVENIVSGVTLEGDNSIVGSAVVIQVSAAGTGTPSGSGTGANQGTANQTGRNGSSTKDKAMAYLACGEITR